MENIFEKELNRPTIFKDRNVLSPHYVPGKLPHREDEIEKIMKTLAPALSGKRYHNLFIYGKTGTGKTASTRYVVDKLTEVKEKYKVNVEAIYINCRIINTKYQVLLKCVEYCYPEDSFLGFPFSHLFDKFRTYVSKNNTKMIVILDEIDKIKGLDDLVYSLTRVNDEMAQGHVGLIGISNNVTFKNELDPRSKSTLCEEEMVFKPYNAEQIYDILKQRSKEGFKKGKVSDLHHGRRRNGLAADIP